MISALCGVWKKIRHPHIAHKPPAFEFIRIFVFITTTATMAVLKYEHFKWFVSQVYFQRIFFGQKKIFYTRLDWTLQHLLYCIVAVAAFDWFSPDFRIVVNLRIYITHRMWIEMVCNSCISSTTTTKIPNTQKEYEASCF